MPAPTVSIVIVSFNRRDTISDALAAATAQTYPHKEILVVDDGSSDKTATFVAARYPEVRVLRVSHRGIAPCRNIGLSVAQGDLVAFLDSDDVARPAWIETLVGALYMGRRRAGVAFCNHWTNDRVPTQKVPRRFDLLSFAIYCPFALAACVFDRRKAIDIGGYDESLPLCEDWDLLFRIWLQHGARFVRRNLYNYRYVSASRDWSPAAPNVTWARRGELIQFEREVRQRNLIRYIRANPRSIGRVVARLESWALKAPFRYKRGLTVTSSPELLRLRDQLSSPGWVANSISTT